MKILSRLKMVTADFITNKEEVEELLRRAGVARSCYVNSDGTVLIKDTGFFYLPSSLVENGKLKVKFDYCKGHFDCEGLLTSLEGCPEGVLGTFTCDNCKIKTLEGSPRKVRDFYCKDCKELTSLKGAPEKVGMDFNCDGCDKLSSLKDGPKKVGQSFNCSGCESLKSLEGIPEPVRFVSCYGCRSLKSLEGLPKSMVSLSCDKSLEEEAKQIYPNATVDAY